MFSYKIGSITLILSRYFDLVLVVKFDSKEFYWLLIDELQSKQWSNI